MNLLQKVKSSLPQKQDERTAQEKKEWRTILEIHKQDCLTSNSVNSTSKIVLAGFKAGILERKKFVCEIKPGKSQKLYCYRLKP